MTDPRVDSLHILLVEDNPGDIHLIREAFGESSLDSSVTAVTDGEEALDYLHHRTDSEAIPDLTLLDLNIPKVSGRDVLETIKTDSNLQSIPVIILTSSHSTSEIRDTYEIGADGYFIKPVDPDEFFSIIQNVEESLADSGRILQGEYSDIDHTT